MGKSVHPKLQTWNLREYEQIGRFWGAGGGRGDFSSCGVEKLNERTTLVEGSGEVCLNQTSGSYLPVDLSQA